MSKYRAKDTPWAKSGKRPRLDFSEPPPHESAHEAARTIDAGMAIDAGRCPNSCGELAGYGCLLCGESHPACGRCGFALHVYPPPVIDPRPTFMRRPTRAGRRDRPS